MILAVVELVSRYYIRTEDTEIKIKPLITLKPKQAYLIFEERFE